MGLGAAGLGRQVDMDMGDKGGGDESDEERGHDAAEDNLRSVAQGLLRLDVGGSDDADEEGAQEERGDLDEGEERGTASPSVEDEYLLGKL